MQQFLSQRAPQPAHWGAPNQEASVMVAWRASADLEIVWIVMAGLVPALRFGFVREEPIERGFELGPPVTGMTDQIVGMCGVSP